MKTSINQWKAARCRSSKIPFLAISFLKLLIIAAAVWAANFPNHLKVKERHFPFQTAVSDCFADAPQAFFLFFFALKLLCSWRCCCLSPVFTLQIFGGGLEQGAYSWITELSGGILTTVRSPPAALRESDDGAAIWKGDASATKLWIRVKIWACMGIKRSDRMWLFLAFLSPPTPSRSSSLCGRWGR